jgi:hypothetical protein
MRNQRDLLRSTGMVKEATGAAEVAEAEEATAVVIEEA